MFGLLANNSSIFEESLPQIATLALFSSNYAHIEAPMPEVPPVIKTTFPSIRIFITSVTIFSWLISLSELLLDVPLTHALLLTETQVAFIIINLFHAVSQYLLNLILH